jgi:riboflavin synthase
VFEIKNIENNMLVNKGSVCVNGVSLTISNTFENSFEVCIIPYTFEHTNFNSLQIGDIVNIEFDILGKYFTKWMQMSGVKQQIND